MAHGNNTMDGALPDIFADIIACPIGSRGVWQFCKKGIAEAADNSLASARRHLARCKNLLAAVERVWPDRFGAHTAQIDDSVAYEKRDAIVRYADLWPERYHKTAAWFDGYMDGTPAYRDEFEQYLAKRKLQSCCYWRLDDWRLSVFEASIAILDAEARCTGRDKSFEGMCAFQESQRRWKNAKLARDGDIRPARGDERCDFCDDAPEDYDPKIYHILAADPPRELEL